MTSHKLVHARGDADTAHVTWNKLKLAGSHTEAISPVAVFPNNKAIYHLRTKQIHLYRTSHTGAMRYPISDILPYCLVIKQQVILLQCKNPLKVHPRKNQSEPSAIKRLTSQQLVIVTVIVNKNRRHFSMTYSANSVTG